MPSQPAPKIGGKEYPIQWVHIDDFSPGCFDGSHTSSEQPVTSQPLGSAYLPNTYCCAVIPGGALGPLPALTRSLPVSTIGGLPGASTVALIAGFIIVPQLDDGSFQVVTIIEADDGTDHYVVAKSYLDLGAVVATIAGPTITSGTVAGFFGAPYPAFTRMNVSGSGTPPPGPVLVFPTAVATDTNGTDGHLWVYPELLSPTSQTAQDLNPGPTPASVTGQVVTYGNRVICLVGQDYDWPVGGGINTNENFNYTDPPESSSYGAQDTIMAVEAPWGYGAWGTISVGELLLVKKDGGGVILNGDINVPTSIIRIPGMQGTGDFVGRASSTPIGLIYCSQGQGAWLWNGGNVSQKISRNISDSFFDLETGNIESNNYGFNVEPWQKWVLFSNNVIYDTETNSWWNLFPKKGINPSNLPAGRDIWWWSQTQLGNQMAASPLQVFANTDPWLSIFDNTVPSPQYQWQSLPIHVTKDADRVIDVRQIVIRASDPTGTGTATITASLNGASWEETSVAADNPISTTPTPLRFNVGLGAQGLYDIVLTIVANNPTANGSAPIIHSIDIGYVVRAGVAVAD